MDTIIEDIKKSTDVNTRYLLVKNNTDEVLYPSIIGYDSCGNLITDINDNFPSGFKLLPSEYKLLKTPRNIIIINVPC